MDAPHVYIKDATIHFTASFTTPPWDPSPGDPVDPSTLELKIKEPSGSVTSYIYGTDMEMVKDSMGEYHADIQVLTGGGLLYYKFIATGSAAGAAEKSCQILAGAF